MKNHKAFLIGCLVAVLGAAAATTTFAQEATPHVDQRQQRQAARIAQGASSGELTVRERRHLHAQQRAVARAEARAKADGDVTRAERRQLDRMQDRASRDIHRQKHDRQRAHRPGKASSAP